MTAPATETAVAGAVATQTLFDIIRAAYVARQLLARRALLATRQAWGTVDPDNFRPSWAGGVGQLILTIVQQAQAQAADEADRTVTAMLLAQGIDPTRAARIDPYAFSGASDGRDLATLLELSNAYALRQISGGQTVDQSLALAGRWLEMVVGTQISDASRIGTSVSTTTRTHVDGWYRLLNPPSCSRCAVLAGRWYRWDAGFERHPRCDCGQVAADDGSLDNRPELWTPEAYFESLSPTAQSRVFTKDGAQAIRDGADIGQVVNARDGMYTAAGHVLTHSGIKHRHGGVRLMPEQIYREAHGSRTEAIRLLTRFGYLQ